MPLTTAFYRAWQNVFYVNAWKYFTTQNWVNTILFWIMHMTYQLVVTPRKALRYIILSKLQMAVGIYSYTFKSVRIKIFSKRLRMISKVISENIWKWHFCKCQNQKCEGRWPLPSIAITNIMVAKGYVLSKIKPSIQKNWQCSQPSLFLVVNI